MYVLYIYTCDFKIFLHCSLVYRPVLLSTESFTLNETCILQPLLRGALEQKPVMTEAEAKTIIEYCMKVLYYRDARAWNKVRSHLHMHDSRLHMHDYHLHIIRLIRLTIMLLQPITQNKICENLLFSLISPLNRS